MAKIEIKNGEWFVDGYSVLCTGLVSYKEPSKEPPTKEPPTKENGKLTEN